MIQKAIVEAVLNDYQVKVRIPKYDKMSYDGASYEELSTAIICSTPGTLVNYSAGDVVLVSFENDEISKPVVLGLLYTDKTTESSVKLPEVSDKLDVINLSLDKLKNRNSYVHIKYSNDGGITFTSLYDYAHVDPSTPVTGNTVIGGNISVNSKSKYIAWNIVDKKGINALNRFDIVTSIKAYNGDTLAYELSGITDKIINIPDSYNYCEKIVIDQYTLTTSQGNIQDYYISLFTDKEPLGSIAGDYIGIYYSNSEIPSSNPIDYSWAALKLRIQEFIDDAYEKLRERVRRNEEYLYGEWYWNGVDNDDDPDLSPHTSTGLDDAVTVYDNEFDVSLKSTVKLSKQENKVFVDTSSNSIYFNNIQLVATSDGHLRIQAGSRGN